MSHIFIPVEFPRYPEGSAFARFTAKTGEYLSQARYRELEREIQRDPSRVHIHDYLALVAEAATMPHSIWFQKFPHYIDQAMEQVKTWGGFDAEAISQMKEVLDYSVKRGHITADVHEQHVAQLLQQAHDGLSTYKTRIQARDAGSLGINGVVLDYALQGDIMAKTFGTDSFDYESFMRDSTRYLNLAVSNDVESIFNQARHSKPHGEEMTKADCRALMPQLERTVSLEKIATSRVINLADLSDAAKEILVGVEQRAHPVRTRFNTLGAHSFTARVKAPRAALT